MKTNQNNEKTVPTQEQIEAACRQSARHFWNWLTWSLVYYVVINLFLIAINWFTSPHYWWVGYKTVTICGTLGALSSIGCLFYPGPNQILIFAPVFIFMMVIPGHVLNHAARKQKKS